MVCGRWLGGNRKQSSQMRPSRSHQLAIQVRDAHEPMRINECHGPSPKWLATVLSSFWKRNRQLNRSTASAQKQRCGPFEIRRISFAETVIATTIIASAGSIGCGIGKSRRLSLHALQNGNNLTQRIDQSQFQRRQKTHRVNATLPYSNSLIRLRVPSSLRI